MSKPKKPGTDLAALKARLAKKTKGADPAPAAPAPDIPAPGQVAAPAPDVPPPGQQMQAPPADVPPPGQQMQAPPADVPAPGQQMQAPADVPAPGQQMQAPPMDVPPPGQPMAAPAPAPAPMPQAAPQMQAPAPTQTSDDPFGGGAGMGGFDPEAGLIDGGEIKPRGNKGIVVFAALLAAGIGAAVGWTGHTIVGKREKIAQGKAKGEKMVAAVQKISDARKSVSLAMEDLKKDIAKDPAASAQKITTLLTDSFDRQPQINELFGWQLASVDPQGLKAAFKLYEQLTELQQNLGMMAKVLTGYGGFIKVGGPSLYGITMSPSGAQMVGIAGSLCGALPPEGPPTPEALAALKPCPPEAGGKAVAYLVLDSGGGKPQAMLRGVNEGQVMMLLPEGKVYDYAIGIEQKNNATNFYKMALTRAEESLTEMNQAEEKALAALKRYAEDPNVDGPAPSAGGEGE